MFDDPSLKSKPQSPSVYYVSYLFLLYSQMTNYKKIPFSYSIRRDFVWEKKSVRKIISSYLSSRLYFISNSKFGMRGVMSDLILFVTDHSFVITRRQIGTRFIIFIGVN